MRSRQDRAAGIVSVCGRVGNARLRSDVPKENVADICLSKPGGRYQYVYKEPYVKLREDVIAFLKTVVPS